MPLRAERITVYGNPWNIKSRTFFLKVRERRNEAVLTWPGGVVSWRHQPAVREGGPVNLGQWGCAARLVLESTKHLFQLEMVQKTDKVRNLYINLSNYTNMFVTTTSLDVTNRGKNTWNYLYMYDYCIVLLIISTMRHIVFTPKQSHSHISKYKVH